MHADNAGGWQRGVGPLTPVVISEGKQSRSLGNLRTQWARETLLDPTGEARVSATTCQVMITTPAAV